jgi:hypothetical protein
LICFPTTKDDLLTIPDTPYPNFMPDRYYNDTPDQTTLPVPPEKLWRVAREQRPVLIMGFVLIVLYGILIDLWTTKSQMRQVIPIFYLTGVTLAAYFAYFLAKDLFRWPVALLLMLGVYLPIVAVLILLYLSVTACKMLKNNGVNVGLLGVDRSALPKSKIDWDQEAADEEVSDVEDCEKD